jgi:hypothetical protein
MDDIRKLNSKSSLNHAMNIYNRRKHSKDFYSKIAVELNGKLIYATPDQLRFLQILCAESANEGKFDDFVNSVVVYNGPVKRSNGKLKWERDGHLTPSPSIYNMEDWYSADFLEVSIRNLSEYFEDLF